MIYLLPIFQFIFLYVPILFIGMTVYGTDLKTGSGYSYIASIVTISIILFLLKKSSYPNIFIRHHKIISIFGGVLALILYRDLHFNFWDEHSLTQALLVFGIGLSSCLSAISASVLLNSNSTSNSSIFLCFGIFSLIWLFSIYYPMSAFLFISLILLIWPLFSSFNESIKKPVTPQFSRYFIFLIFMDLPLVIWDFQVNTEWGVYLAIYMLACGTGMLFKIKPQHLILFYTTFILNFIYCAANPEFVLNPAHSFISAFVLGIYLNNRTQNINISFSLFPALAAPAFVGLIVSIVFYSNLTFANWRLIFIIPVILFFIKNKITGFKKNTAH